VPSNKLLILSHPLTRKTREFFEKVYFNKFKKYKEKRKVMSLMLPGDVKFGFRRADYSPITAKEREEEWIRVVDLIKDIMPSWKIYIKPHPLIQNIKELTQAFESLSNQVKVVKPSEPADKYIEIADIIVGLPLGASTVLFTASLQCPKKPILSLDFYRETVGDIYKDFEGIEYINSKEKFIDVLKLIRDKKYHKKNKKESGGFSDAVEVLKYSLRKKNETH
jgi:hypothetical protein